MFGAGYYTKVTFSGWAVDELDWIGSNGPMLTLIGGTLMILCALVSLILPKVKYEIEGIYDYLIPVFTVIFAYLIIDERITGQQAVGALIIFVGVYLARIGYTKFISNTKYN